MSIYDESLEYHKKLKGKLEIKLKEDIKNKKDLSLAYTPGVAQPCRKIAEDKSKVFRYTIKGHTVAIVTDGTSVLGLGDIGPEAALPVMEAKSIIFKEKPEKWGLRGDPYFWEYLEDIFNNYELPFEYEKLEKIIKDEHIKLTGTGEKLNALEDFYPERMATRILGMGDIVSLVERAQEVFDEKTAQEMEKKMAKAEFSFNDFLKMQSQMKMFGSMDNLLGMIPGLGLSKDDRQKISHEGEKQFKRIEVFIQSMTPEEREHPELMNTSRKKRISQGCGLPLHEVNQFISQFEQMRKMMKGFSDVKKNMGKLGGKLGADLGSKLTAHQMMKNMRRFK